MVLETFSLRELNRQVHSYLPWQLSIVEVIFLRFIRNALFKNQKSFDVSDEYQATDARRVVNILMLRIGN